MGAYAGHQFGHFVMLGDGRVILLGEQITPLMEQW
ncbi:protein adenylyltransferase SelO family protein [Natranaerovirga pectinivora]|nr:protein adenylyltransferase SelO family protein [Natranaerovirga pectinivora]